LKQVLLLLPFLWHRRARPFFDRKAIAFADDVYGSGGIGANVERLA
jgi:hypothetical protein